jgi:4-hydroxybenzoate polyprenyltransferase
MIIAAMRAGMKQVLDYLLFGCLWIAFCTFLLTLESLLLLGLPALQPALLGFVTAAAFTHYNLHYWSKGHAHTARGRWSARHPLWHVWGIGLGLVCMAVSGLFLQVSQWTIIVFSGGIALIYSLPLLPRRKRLKEFGLVKVMTLSLVWTITTVALPGFESVDQPLFWFMIGRRFLFMMVLCLAFDIRDDAADHAAGIQTYPVRYGRQATYRLIDLLLGIFVLTTFCLGLLSQRYLVSGAMILSALFTRLAVRGGECYPSERYYLAIVDGMMPLQAVLLILALWCERAGH